METFWLFFSSTACFSSFRHNNLGLYLGSEKCLDPDPDSMNPDSKYYIKHSQVYEYRDMNALKLPKFHPDYYGTGTGIYVY